MIASPVPAAPATTPALSRLQLVRFAVSGPLYMMLTLLVIEALLAATTTWLIIKAGRDVVAGNFIVYDLLYIVLAQSTSYLVGASSWIFAERAGFRAYGRYIAQFGRLNRQRTELLGDRNARERGEPFLTGETFYTIFNLITEMESQLKLMLALIFNSIVLGAEIDGSLPVAYGAVFVVLMILQYSLRKRISGAYLENQRQNNRLTAHGYTAWDNVFTGNRYNFRIWFAGFKSRMRATLRAQIIAIVAREGLSAVGGIIGLVIIFSAITMIAIKDAGNAELLIALAATLPRQIEMTNDVHQLSSDWNDVLAGWTRLGGVTANIRPEADPLFRRRIKFGRLTLREGDEKVACKSVDEAMAIINAKPTGRVNVRGGNGSGKSTLLAALKSDVRTLGYYWPTSDRLAFAFTAARAAQATGEPDEETGEIRSTGFSSGERQLRSLEEIVAHTQAAIYLLDEWDANLDPSNRAAADALVEQLATRARVIEISHRDR